MKPCIRVLLAEDSATVYQFLQFILMSQSDIKVVGWAKNGEEAVKQNAMLRPDLIIMDLHMPLMDGLQATQAIMSSTPTPILMVTATANPDDVALSLEALRAGALALIEKPKGLQHKAHGKITRKLLQMIRALVEVKTVKLRPVNKNAQQYNQIEAFKPKVITIAASTGGPQALALIFSALDHSFPLPILLVQHIGIDFNEGFITWMQSCTNLKVSMAMQNQRLQAGHLYIAGNDQHLGVTTTGRITLSDMPPIAGFRPSANYLFESVAYAFGKHATAVVLTGMGNDGTAGLTALSKQGGYIVAQDKRSSVVYGMPKAAKDAGIVSDEMSLQEIANWLLAMQQSTNVR